jgi:hypothetical protein
LSLYSLFVCLFSSFAIFLIQSSFLLPFLLLSFFAFSIFFLHSSIALYLFIYFLHLLTAFPMVIYV